MGDERTYADALALRAVHSTRRHDRRLGAAAVRPARDRSRRASSTRSRASTAWSTTSRRSRPRRSSGSSRAALALIATRRRRSRRAWRARDRGRATPLKQTRAGVDRRLGGGDARGVGRGGGRPAHAQRRPVASGRRSGARRRPRWPSCAARWRALPLGCGQQADGARDRSRGRARARRRRPVPVERRRDRPRRDPLRRLAGDAQAAPDGAGGRRGEHAPGGRADGPDRQARRARRRRRLPDRRRQGATRTSPTRKVDKDGRLVLAGDAQLADKLARGLVMIYVGKLQR